jgi:ornithine carbamoyltransferase
MTRHFLDLSEITRDDLLAVLHLAKEPRSNELDHKSVAMVFEKPSNRTRNATEMAVVDLGGHAIMISNTEVGIDQRESAEDVARTLGCFHRIVAMRVFDHDVLTRARTALDAGGWDVSVVNLLSDFSHPCQAIADLLTLIDHFDVNRDLSDLRGKKLCYVGDANNVTRSLAQAALLCGMEIAIAAPTGYQLDQSTMAALDSLASLHGGSVSQSADLGLQADQAHVLYTDVWTSMGQEDEAAQRRRDLADFTISDDLLRSARTEAVVLHCLPAHRGEEVSHEVLEGPQSLVWQQAAHRRTAMRGVFRWIMSEETT